MIELKLTANGKEQELIKEYLQNNVSDILADKINNGVKITKDNKTLINKKDLDDFMKFATEEARKQAKEHSSYACIEDSVVYGWAIHYFEEETIEGKLYNEDGSEYKTEIKPTNTPKIEIKKEPEKPKQATLFDFLSVKNEINNNENNEKIQKNNEKIIKNQDFFEKNEEKVEIFENNLSNEIDFETGEIKNSNLILLNKLLDGKVIER